MVTIAIALCKKGAQPSRACSECYTFPATTSKRGVSLYLYLGSIKYELD